MAREYPPYLIPHAEHGEPHCLGLLFAVPRAGGAADFDCNDCGAIVRIVRSAHVPAAIQAMRIDRGEGVSLACPPLRLTEFPGDSEMFAFTCRHCGNAATLRKGITRRSSPERPIIPEEEERAVMRSGS